MRQNESSSQADWGEGWLKMECWKKEDQKEQ